MRWLLGVVAAAWVVTGVLDARGIMARLHHDNLLGAGGVSGARILAFLGSWQLMTAAMMLPSLLPILRHVRANSVRVRRLRGVLLVLLAYFAVWTLFAVAAVVGDRWVHDLVATSSRLASNPALISAAVLAVAALWQLSPLKRACLRSCRPRGFIPLEGWRADVGVLRLGVGQGAACVGSCWAMMLVMFAAGPGQLGWMVSIAAATYAEKNLRRGPRVARHVGMAFASLAAATALAPLVLAPH
jgi:predicted metal-binding membrane protein